MINFAPIGQDSTPALTLLQHGKILQKRKKKEHENSSQTKATKTAIFGVDFNQLQCQPVVQIHSWFSIRSRVNF